MLYSNFFKKTVVETLNDVCFLFWIQYIYIYIYIYIYLSTYNSLLIPYKVYTSDPSEYLCSRWRYGEPYVYLSINLPPCRNNPIKNKLVIPKYQSLPLWESYIEKKNLTVNVWLENFIRNVLKEHKLWNRMFKPVFG